MSRVDALQSFRDLLEAGFPRWQIAEQVRKHVRGLEALPADTPDLAHALDDANEFLALLVVEHGGELPTQ